MVTETAAVRPRIGIVFGGERGLYTRLTARQNLRYWAALYHLRDDEGAARTDERRGLLPRHEAAPAPGARAGR